MDLLSLVFTLTPLQAPPPEALLPLWWGRAAHALLLNVVRCYNPALAESLHQDNTPRPFSASTLIGRSPAGRYDPAETYTLRFTAIQSELAQILAQAVQPGNPLAVGATVELDYHPFRIQTVRPNPQSELRIPQSDIPHPQSAPPNPQSAIPNPQSELRNPQSDPSWSAANSYQELSASLLLAKQPAPRRITLQFASPTTFKTGGKHLPLPLPELVFGSLLDRWNAFAPILFPAETRRYAAECLGVSHYRLSTRRVPLKSGGVRLGCVGQITYTSLNYDRYWMSVVGVLAAFALYAGVGAGVSMGLGQCRQLPQMSESEPSPAE